MTLILTKYLEPTPAPTKLPQQISASGQIFPTVVDPGSILSSHWRRSRSGAVIGSNRSKIQPNISNRRRGSNNLHRVASTLLARCRDYSQISPTDTAVPLIVSNRRRDLMNYSQPTQGISNPAPWLSPKAIWNIDNWWSSNALVGGFLHHYDRLTDFRLLIPVWLVLSV